MKNFNEMDIKKSYVSCGEDNIAHSFIGPVLAHTKTYMRSVGFFSSSVFDVILDGIVSLHRNGGKIKLIASPKLSAEDIEAINLGYEKKEEIAKNCFDQYFMAEIDKLDEVKLKVLAELIAKDTLDIKIALTKTSGMYHDKLGVLEDFSGNRISFVGSSNSSFNGYVNNYEKIRISRSWIAGENESVNDEYNEFVNLWEEKNPYIDIYNYEESARKNILKVIQKKKNEKLTKAPIKLRDYQEEAIKAWVDNGYHGFYVMATGTGKTWTAIYAVKECLEKNKAILVICAPYKHLVKQWSEDIVKVFPEASIIMVSSENTKWEDELVTSLLQNKYNENKQVIVITTISSFNLERFKNTINKTKRDKILVVDEAHRFTKRTDDLHVTYKYMLGLSATPFSGKKAEKGKLLMDFFGGQVYRLDIEEALQRKFLVPYSYHPIFYSATEDEENSFKYFSVRMAACFKNGVCIDPEKCYKLRRSQLRVISMAEAKNEHLGEIINAVKNKDHFVVYCGDGMLFDNDENAEIRHIQSVINFLAKKNLKASQFTAKENMDERMELVNAFNKGHISTLVAIRCLDEGINIPSIKSAVILSSNDDYREFVQRRGRILRLFEGKEKADIYDVLILPSNNAQGMALIELRRFYEYARLSLNWDTELKTILDDYLKQYGFTYDDIAVYDYEDMEVTEDE